MKHKSLVILLSIFAITLRAQEKRLEVAVGSQLLVDLIHVGLDYRITKNQSAGFQFGVYFDHNDRLGEFLHYGIRHNYFYRFKKEKRRKKSNNLDYPTWYVSSMLSYIKEQQNNFYRWEYYIFGISIGKNFYLKENIGIKIDLGPAITFYEHQISTGPYICHSCRKDNTVNQLPFPILRLDFYWRL